MDRDIHTLINICFPRLGADRRQAIVSECAAAYAGKYRSLTKDMIDKMDAFVALRGRLLQNDMEHTDLVSSPERCRKFFNDCFARRGGRKIYGVVFE